MGTKGEWGVKDAAERLAKMLRAKGRKCEVVEGDEEWPVKLVVDGTAVPMRTHALRCITTNKPGEPIKNEFQIVYGWVHFKISRTGHVDLDEIEKLIVRKDAESVFTKRLGEVRTVVEQYAAIVSPVNDGGVSRGGLVGLRVHNQAPGMVPGRIDLHFEGDINDVEPVDLHLLIDAISKIQKRSAARKRGQSGQEDV